MPEAIIVVANSKGGTGKTTTTATLGRIFSMPPYNRGVLMLDMDPQSSLTLSFGITKAQAERANLSHAMRRDRTHQSLDRVIRYLGGMLYLAPSHKEQMDELEREMAVRVTGRDTALKRALREIDWPDLILIDTAPALGILKINALVVATHVIVPTKPAAVDIGGLGEFLDTLDEVYELNEGLVRLGILLTFYHPRYRMHRAALAGLTTGETIGGFRVFDTMIGDSVKVAEAPGEAVTVVDYQPDNKRAQEYRALAQEVLERMGL